MLASVLASMATIHNLLHTCIYAVPLLYTYQILSVLEAATIIYSWCIAAGLWGFPMLQEISPRFSLRKKQRTESDSTYPCLIIDTLKHRLLEASKANTPEASNKGAET